MPTEVIPFGNLQESGYDELSGASPIAMNVVADGKGAVLRRPGIRAYSGAPGFVVATFGIDGIYSALTGDLFAVGKGVAERPIYRVTSAGAPAIGSGNPPAGLRGSARPKFAETELLLAIAGGDVMQKVVLPTAHFALSSSRMGGTPPPVASHVVSSNTRLVANDVAVDRTKVRFSDVALGDTDFSGNEVWSLGGVGTSGYFTAEANPDPVVAIEQVQNELLVFGSKTTQVFLPDAQFTYAPVATIELGMSAPYSFVKGDRECYWLDHYRRLVLSDRRSFQSISDPIQRTIDNMAVVSDCFGYRVAEAYIDVPVFTFPTDGRTFAYQKETGWGQWAGWDESSNAWTQFPVTCLTTPADASVNIVGLVDGSVGELTLEANTDRAIGLGTTSRINAFIQTGYLNRGTDEWKHCQCVHVALRRGTTTAATGPLLLLHYRDQPGEWTGPIPVGLGASGDTEIVVPLHSLGVYRRRQWMFTFSDTEVALGLISVKETYSVENGERES